MTRISVSGSRGGSRAMNGLVGNSLSLLGAQSSSMIIGTRARPGAGDGATTGGGPGLRPHHNLGSHMQIQPLYPGANTNANRGAADAGRGMPSGGGISHLSRSLEQN